MDIREIRRELGLSQSDLANALGLHQSTISKFETGAMPLDERTKLAVDALLLRAKSETPADAQVAA